MDRSCTATAHDAIAPPPGVGVHRRRVPCLWRDGGVARWQVHRAPRRVRPGDHTVAPAQFVRYHDHRGCRPRLERPPPPGPAAPPWFVVPSQGTRLRAAESGHISVKRHSFAPPGPPRSRNPTARECFVSPGGPAERDAQVVESIALACNLANGYLAVLRMDPRVACARSRSSWSIAPQLPSFALPSLPPRPAPAVIGALQTLSS
jgi:hypothetical protein